MLIELLLTLDYNPETKTVSIVNQKVTKETEPTKKKTGGKKSKKEEDPNPKIYLEDNKLTFNTAAAELIGVEAGERLSIIYQNEGDLLFPVIAKDETLGCEGGNLFNKSMTLSCRGKANEKLREFGTEFSLVDIGQGLFKMDGGIEVEASNKIKADKNIKIKESEEVEEDLPMEAVLDETKDVDVNEEFSFDL